LEDQSSKLTRRSAGIPAIIACILIPSSLEDFNGAIENLVSLARSEKVLYNSTGHDEQVRFPQVHALNCLREIFTTSRFKERTASWLTRVLDLAASSLSSDVWAIRNCGLMLFRACASRVGPAADFSDSESRGLAAPDESEGVVGIAFMLLEAEQEVVSSSPELVFAGLDLLGRITVPEYVRSRAEEKIIQQLGSRIWMIREHAARIYASQTPETKALEAAVHLISSMSPRDQNKCHGVLLCSRELLGKHLRASMPFTNASAEALRQALNRQAPSIHRHAAPAVHCAFLGVLNDFIASGTHSPFQIQERFCENSYETRQFQLVGGSETQIRLRKPSEPQLQSSAAIHSSLLVLTGERESTQKLYEIFRSVATYDLDAAAALLQAIQDHGSANERGLRLRIELYTTIIQDHYDEAITEAAIVGFCSCFEHVLESKQPFILRRKLDTLTDSFMALPYRGCRDLFNARIWGLGGVLAYRSAQTQSVWHQHNSAPLNQWIIMLSSAAKDETEAGTRLNALNSLNCFRHCFLQDCDGAGSGKKLVLYSILYDFLNDDEVEIRDLAADIVSFILGSAVDGVKLQLCPLAACYRISSYLAESFSSNNEFHLIALSRIMFPMSVEPGALRDFAGLVSRHSIEKQFRIACQECHELFEEERPNLYWDDIREINIWYLALGKISAASLNHDVRTRVGEWALEGLLQLTNSLPGLIAGPFGILSKVEPLTVFMSAIRLADICLHWDCGSGLGARPTGRSSYLVGMERLLLVVQECSIHPQVQKALEDGIRRGQLALKQYKKTYEESSSASTCED
jgi:Putative death-receptor fusion protein (DUF2428)